MCCNRQLFREPGWEAQRREPRPLPSGAEPDEADNLDRAMRRARSAVHDIAMSNDWAWFVTLTLDARQVDRYDMTAITRKMNNWLDNHVRRHGLAYVLVPERHKDGAVHFHGFFNDALRAVDSRHKDGHGHRVYNLPQWTLGFTTAIALYGNKQSAVGYVCKYVSKQREKIGGRWYYSGGALRKPEIQLTDANIEDMEAAPEAGRFEVPQLPNIRFAALTSQGFCDVNQPPAKICENGDGLTFFGLSTAAAAPPAPAAPVHGAKKMTPKKLT